MNSKSQTGLIAFGSNQGDSEQIFADAIAELDVIAGVNVETHSTPVWTDPIQGKAGDSQPDNSSAEPPSRYLNAVVRIQTSLAPRDLHLQTAAIEHQFGRVRRQRWGSRTIDLDLLMLGDCIVESDSLTLPHPRMTFRRFVLAPATQIAADLVHPIAGCSIGTLFEKINMPQKTMGLVCGESEESQSQLDRLVQKLSEISSCWHFEKIFSENIFSQVSEKITLLALFDDPGLSPTTSWRQLCDRSIHFAGPALRLKTTPEGANVLTELAAAIQTIG